MDFFKFPSIESFHHKVKAGKKYAIGERSFNIKPKLHGTNAGIVFHPDYGVYAQSRQRVISVDSDNMQFARFVEDLAPSYTSDAEHVVVLFGEWAGSGIQSKDAITKIGKKIFAPFALIEYNKHSQEPVSVETEPEALTEFVNNNVGYHEDIVVIDVVDTISINFNGNPDDLEKIADTLNTKINIYETVDTWVRDKFGVEAPGEGFVLTPSTEDYDVFYNWSFKMKTEAHAVNKSSKSAAVYVEPSSDVTDFVDRFVTEMRLQQAVSELGGDDDMDMKKMGEFLKWVGQDIKKESVLELEASSLEWRDVAKLITQKSRIWFINKYR